MKITIPIFAVAVLILVAAALLLLFNSGKIKEETSVAQNNVSIVDNRQVIEINVKGGYSPKNTVAKADIPTAIKFKNKGTFDCSSSVVIPELGYRANLPMTGETSVDVPAQKSGAILNGTCAMGMYEFSIVFERRVKFL
ncbi:MAG: cupredoxin domain-containing protein [Patescibacteria group bacterium]|nr:cupredoxin domain-containing protein [Patescibacteria group bacterium]